MGTTWVLSAPDVPHVGPMNLAIRISSSFHHWNWACHLATIDGATILVHCSMMTSSTGNIFRVTGPLCGEFTGQRWIRRAQRPVTRSFDVFIDLCLNKRLSKQSWGWWLETASRSLWSHSNASLRNSFEDEAPVDEMYRHPIFKWVLVTWFNQRNYSSIIVSVISARHTPLITIFQNGDFGNKRRIHRVLIFLCFETDIQWDTVKTQ